MGDPSSNGEFGRPKLGPKSFMSGLAKPGPRNPSRSKAGSVASVNGKIARPGFHEKTPKAASGKGEIARPGGNQKIKG